MVSLDQIQAYMRDQLVEDGEKSFVNVSGESLEDALSQASIELGIPVRRIEYEVLERGARGVLGVGRKPCLILAYPAKHSEQDNAGPEVAIDLSLLASDAEPADRDGGVFVRLTPDGIMMKVTRPVGSGDRATEREALEKLYERVDDGIDKGAVARVVKHASGDFVKVGDFDYDPSADASLSVEVADSEMKAYLVAYAPGDGGADPSYEQVVAFLQSHGVVAGIDEDAIRGFTDDPVYRETILVAEGTPPKNGADASVKYSFDRDPGQVQLKEKNGRVDFKELNLLQNVVQGQVLAKKVPAARGDAGRTVTGRLIAATDGKDIDMPVGKNVRVSEDGTVALAEINGQVVLSGGRLTVEPVHVIAGDVNLRTGNILFLGTVLVKGSVDDGFTIKAAGNIEVMGSVGKSKLDAEGDVIVHQGVAGKGGGVIRSGKSIWAKFIENSRVESSDLVVVSDGIINSTVLSDRKVICRGKRASIVGGHVTAVEEISAKSLGAVAGSETILEVGYDPRRKEKLSQIEEKRSGLQQRLEEIVLNMSTIENLIRAKRPVADDKKAFYQDLKGKKLAIGTEIAKLDDEAAEIREYLNGLQVTGRISASGTVFPGVRISIRDAFLEVRNEFRAVSFIADKQTVKVTKYEEPDEDLTIGRKG